MIPTALNFASNSPTPSKMSNVPHHTANPQCAFVIERQDVQVLPPEAGPANAGCHRPFGGYSSRPCGSHRKNGARTDAWHWQDPRPVRRPPPRPPLFSAVGFGSFLPRWTRTSCPLLCGAWLPADPLVCVSLSLWPPRRASDKNASTGCLYTSLLERGERKKGRKREEREVERGKEKERTRGTRQQLGGRRKEEEEGERKEEDGGSPCSRGSRSGTSPGGSGSRSRRCW